MSNGNKPKKKIDTRSFSRKTYDGGKEVVLKHGVSGLIALLISSVVPMLEQWHSDKQYKDEITAVGQDATDSRKELEDRMNKRMDSIELNFNTSINNLKDDDNSKITELKTDENTKITTIWQYLRTQETVKNKK